MKKRFSFKFWLCNLIYRDYLRNYLAELFTSLRNDINNLIKERDDTVAALKEKSEN